MKTAADFNASGGASSPPPEILAQIEALSQKKCFSKVRHEPTPAFNKTGTIKDKPRLLTDQEFQDKKNEVLRAFLSKDSGAEELVNKKSDYNESDYLGTPDPADFEAFWTEEY